jgi:hypothetical protein
MLRDPDRMTMEERDKEISHLLGKGLLRWHRFNKRLNNRPSDAMPRGSKAEDIDAPPTSNDETKH